MIPMLTNTHAGTDSTLYNIGLPHAQLPNQGRDYFRSDPKPARALRWAPYTGRRFGSKGRNYCTSYL